MFHGDEHTLLKLSRELGKQADRLLDCSFCQWAALFISLFVSVTGLKFSKKFHINSLEIELFKPFTFHGKFEFIIFPSDLEMQEFFYSGKSRSCPALTLVCLPEYHSNLCFFVTKT